MQLGPFECGGIHVQGRHTSTAGGEQRFRHHPKSFGSHCPSLGTGKIEVTPQQVTVRSAGENELKPGTHPPGTDPRFDIAVTEDDGHQISHIGDLAFDLPAGFRKSNRCLHRFNHVGRIIRLVGIFALLLLLRLPLSGDALVFLALPVNRSLVKQGISLLGSCVCSCVLVTRGRNQRTTLDTALPITRRCHGKRKMSAPRQWLFSSSIKHPE
jgi:hypothetical protein